MTALNHTGFNPNRKGVPAEPVDLSKIKPGDQVTIFGTYRGIDGRNGNPVVSMTAATGRIEYDFDAKEIASHTARPLMRGDKVWGVSSKCGGEVLHTICDLAWVKFEDGRHEIVLPDQVERVS